jgi:hypothetical protein
MLKSTVGSSPPMLHHKNGEKKTLGCSLKSSLKRCRQPGEICLNLPRDATPEYLSKFN